MSTSESLRGKAPTYREMQVIRLVARGMTSTRIGEDLRLSPLTVKKHLARIRTKFGVHSRAGIVGAATRAGHLVVPVEFEPPAGFDEAMFDVLVRVARGLTDNQIAAELALSLDVVKMRVRRLLALLGVGSREEAVVAGVACGALRLVPARRCEPVAA